MTITEGSVVIVSTGQVGTAVLRTAATLWVLLANGDIWVGTANQAHVPQCAEEIACAPRDIKRLK